MFMKNKANLIITLTSALFLLPFAIIGQSLYGFDQSTSSLVEYDPMTLSPISTIAALSGDSTNIRGMAMNSDTGTMFISTPSNLATIDLDTAVVTSIAPFSAGAMRSLVFDDSGKLWAIDNSAQLVSIDPSNAQVTLERSTFSFSVTHVDFQPSSGLLFLLGTLGSGEVTLASFSPSDSSILTPITVSPATDPLGSIVAGGVYDPINDRFLFQESTNKEFFGINSSGTISSITTASGNVMGLAFDQGTTASVDDWMIF